MNQGVGNHKLIVQYLLGELSDQERAQLEEQYFADDDLFEEFLFVEGELTDAYWRGELTGQERERFEAQFLASSRRHQRVDFAGELIEYAAETSAAAQLEKDFSFDDIIRADDLIRALLRTTRNQTRAAEILKMPVRSLRHLLIKYLISLREGLHQESGGGAQIEAYSRAKMSERFEPRLPGSPWWKHGLERGRELIEYGIHGSSQPAASGAERVTSSRSLLEILGAKSRAIIVPLVAVVLIISVAGLVFETVRLRVQIGHIQADRAETLQREQDLERQLGDQRGHNEQVAAELERERSQRELLEQELAKPERSTLSAITFILTPDLVRGASEPKRVIIPQRADLVRMQLDLDRDDYKSYRAVLATVEGKRIWSSGSLKARPTNSDKVVTLGLPASLFTKRGYIITLSGANADGSLANVSEYYFNVVKK